jgi:hypothetical protein
MVIDVNLEFEKIRAKRKCSKITYLEAKYQLSIREN